MKIETKYDIGQEVWVMKDNHPQKFKVNGISVECLDGMYNGCMKKNELRFSKTLIGYELVSLWSIRPDCSCDYLIDGAYGDTKMKAVWALIKWLYRYGKLTELLYIKSIKYERN